MNASITLYSVLNTGIRYSKMILLNIHVNKSIGFVNKELVEVLELNVRPDHIHLVMDIPPKYPVSEVMGYLKGKLALRLFEKYEHLGRRYWGRHLWSRGYCVSTIGLDEDKIRKYVKWQEQQDKKSESHQGELF